MRKSEMDDLHTIKQEPNDDESSTGINLNIQVKVEQSWPECELNENKGIPPNLSNNAKPLVWDCSFCGIMFLSSYQLLKHNLRHLHVPLRRIKFYQCEICLLCYTEKEKLIKHLIIKHPKYYRDKSIHDDPKKTHECTICETKYAYKSWQQHMKAVHNNDSYICKICKKTFKAERYLKRHELYIHEGLVPSWKVKQRLLEKCPHCEKSFRNTDCLRHHIKNVHSSGGKKFTCPICNSTLKAEAYLRAHVQRVHYDDGKKYECDKCVKKFKSPRYLSYHVKNSHMKTKSKINFENETNTSTLLDDDFLIDTSIKKSEMDFFDTNTVEITWDQM